MNALVLTLLFGLLQDAPVEEQFSILLERSNKALAKGDYKSADEGYRRIVSEAPRTVVWGRALYNLGFSLMKQKRYPEARAEFERLLKADVNDNEPGDHIMELQRNYRPKAIVHIGECYEAEGNWEKALEAYENQGRYPMRSWCGNCKESMEFAAVSRIVRAQFRCGKLDDAMKTCREMIFGPEGLGSSCAEICFIAVDIAIAQACLDAFERELRIKADKPRPKTALGYLRVLRLRASGDYEGLYQVIRSAGMTSLEPHYWEETRRRDPVAAEAAECLGELGDAAFEWLCGRARVESEKKAALIAIAHFKTAKALDFIRALPVRPDTRDALDIRCLEKIHAAPVRARSYPPRREPMK